jgi:hypothetical protein
MLDIDFLESGTADLSIFVSEDFQLNYDQSISGMVYSSKKAQISEEKSVPEIELILIDGELRILERGVIPGYKPLLRKAGILQIGE